MDTAADGRVTWNGIKCFRINDRKKLSKKQASARWKDKVPSPTGELLTAKSYRRARDPISRRNTIPANEIFPIAS
jgi:hypothetical protein